MNLSLPASPADRSRCSHCRGATRLLGSDGLKRSLPSRRSGMSNTVSESLQTFPVVKPVFISLPITCLHGTMSHQESLLPCCTRNWHTPSWRFRGGLGRQGLRLYRQEGCSLQCWPSCRSLYTQHGRESSPLTFLLCTLSYIPLPWWTFPHPQASPECGQFRVRPLCCSVHCGDTMDRRRWIHSAGLQRSTPSGRRISAPQKTRRQRRRAHQNQNEPLQKSAGKTHHGVGGRSGPNKNFEIQKNSTGTLFRYFREYLVTWKSVIWAGTGHCASCQRLPWAPLRVHRSFSKSNVSASFTVKAPGWDGTRWATLKQLFHANDERRQAFHGCVPLCCPLSPTCIGSIEFVEEGQAVFCRAWRLRGRK